MKHISFFAACLMIAASNYSQNIGIGTNSPAAKLDVKTTSSYVAQFNGNAPMYMGIFENDVYRGYIGSLSGVAEDVDFGTGKGNTTGKLHLTIENIPKLTINAAGLVGIGTTNPLYRAHIEDGDVFFHTGKGLFRLGLPATHQWAIGAAAGGADLTWSSAADATNFTARHYFSQNGNVGIGVGSTAPIGRLEVKGLSTTSFTNTFLLRNSSGDTLMRMRDDGRMGIGYNGAYNRTLTLGGTGMNFFTANEANYGGAIFPTDTSLVMWSNSSSNNYLVFQPSWGNTGIGTYSPNAKLHLNGFMLIGPNSARTALGYALSVVGRVIAEDFTTQLSTSWPDYVFDNDYALMPLEKLCQYVSTNKHLPGIPEAAIMEKEGIKLGEITRKLTEKIEELTLYILELNRKNEELSRKMLALERGQQK